MLGVGIFSANTGSVTRVLATPARAAKFITDLDNLRIFTDVSYEEMLRSARLSLKILRKIKDLSLGRNRVTRKEGERGRKLKRCDRASLLRQVFVPEVKVSRAITLAYSAQDFL